MKKNKTRRKVPMRVIIPNMITSASVFCGVSSLIMTFHHKFIPAAILIFCAAFFDLMDGRAARRLGGGSQFGEEMDSLADAISFGVAPAFLMYATFIGIEMGIWGAVAASFFSLCAVLRLARFNVVHMPTGPFQGLPSPAGGLTLVSFVLAGFPLTPLFAIAIMFFTGGLMVSSVPFCNSKKLHKHNVNKVKMNILRSLVVICFLILRERAFLAFAATYIAIGLLRFDVSSWVMLEPQEEDEVCN